MFWSAETVFVGGNVSDVYRRFSAYIDVYIVSPMAKSRQSIVQDKIDDLTKCSICAEIFTNPKILPCVHTFCLCCLETDGKDKQPGDQITCPICRNEFAIPNGGLRNLPSNFFIGEMVEIGKLSMAPVNEAKCNICPEGEEVVANMYCTDCEQILCERCSKSHKKTKSSQSHQVVELGSKLNAPNFNLRNSYCKHHPGELLKMYCYNDNVTICLICCVESHQSHRCVNVAKAAEECTKRLKEDLEKVTNRLPECDEAGKNLDQYKKEFLMEISKTEESIRNAGTKLKELIDQHTERLVQNLKSVMEQNLKAVEITKQDVERFRVMIESYARYSEELLSRGSHADICRAADQMHRRANELETLPSNCSGDCFRCDYVAFHPSSFESLLKQCNSNNAVGDLSVTESPDRIIKFEIESKVAKRLVREESVVYQGSRLMITKHVEEDRSQKPFHPDRTINVSNILSAINKETLEMIFKSLWYGGGETDNIVYNQAKGTAVITFKDPKVAKTLIRKGVLVYKGNRLAITRSVEPIESANQYQSSSVSSRMVDVSEILPGTTMERLTMLLENFSGGEIESIDYNQNRNTAVVTFKDSAAANILISEKSVVYKGEKLFIARRVENANEIKHIPK